MHFKTYTLIVFFAIFFQDSFAFHKLPATLVTADSIGVERIGGEMYILHQVSRGETLFSLSRRYTTEVTDIRKSNLSVDVDNLGIGDTLRVPLFPQFTQGKKSIHTVKEGETLYRLSKEYDASISDIKKWNALGRQPLAIGQQIVIYHVEHTRQNQPQNVIDEKKYVVHTVMQGETLFAISRAYDVTVKELMRRNKLADERISFGQELIIRERELLVSPELAVTASTNNAPTIPEPMASREEKESEGVKRNLTRAEALEQEKQRIRAIRAAEKKALSDFEKKSELGFAAAIEGGVETQKFLALHRTAPVGTIIQIRNEMNNLSVFVRVVGKLPNTGVNEKVSIRITRATYDKLGGINERFPVEITYIQ